MPQTKSAKTKPRKVKQPTLTEQINILNSRKQGIQEGQAKITASMSDHQERLDKAEAFLVDRITDELADPSPENREAVSEARIAKNVILREFEQHNHDLKMLPTALEKINIKLKALKSEKATLERGVIAHKLGDIEPLKAAARQAIAELGAAMCMTTTRNLGFVGVKEVVLQLNKDKSITYMLSKQFNELEASMEFEKL